MNAPQLPLPRTSWTGIYEQVLQAVMSQATLLQSHLRCLTHQRESHFQCQGSGKREAAEVEVEESMLKICKVAKLLVNNKHKHDL